MAENASRDSDVIDEIISDALSRNGNPVPFPEAKKLLGEILNVTRQPLLSKSDKMKKIDLIIHNKIDSLNLDNE